MTLFFAGGSHRPGACPARAISHLTGAWIEKVGLVTDEALTRRRKRRSNSASIGFTGSPMIRLPYKQFVEQHWQWQFQLENDLKNMGVDIDWPKKNPAAAQGGDLTPNQRLSVLFAAYKNVLNADVFDLSKQDQNKRLLTELHNAVVGGIAEVKVGQSNNAAMNWGLAADVASFARQVSVGAGGTLGGSPSPSTRSGASSRRSSRRPRGASAGEGGTPAIALTRRLRTSSP
jgi:hypothetical protein